MPSLPDPAREQVSDAFGKARLAWLSGFSGILLCHLIWLLLNEWPPAWDMAQHQILGWLHLQALREGMPFHDLVRISDYYPPLYYLIEAAFLGLFGATRFLPLLANLPGLALLGYCSFRTAWMATGTRTAAWAGVIPLMFPLVAWTSRESLLDPTTAGLASAALLLSIQSRGFETGKATLGFCLVCAAGMLVKWTFLLFIIPLVAVGLFRSMNLRRSAFNLVTGLVLAAPAVLVWYWPNLASLQRRFQLTAAASDWEMDPASLSPLGLVYYLRCLSSYYLFLPLTCFFVGALIRWTVLLKKSGTTVLVPVMAALAGGILLLTAMKSKDPRYMMPLAGPVAVILVSGWTHRPGLVRIIGIFSIIQFGLISFGPPSVRVSFFSIPQDTDFSSIRQEWVWFETDYFGITGPPRKGDWHFDRILDTVAGSGRVGFVPDSAPFHGGILRLKGLETGQDVEVVQLGSSSNWTHQVRQLTWVVGKTGFQGVSFITQLNPEIYRYLEVAEWPLTAKWELPDGSQAMIWRNPTRSR